VGAANPAKLEALDLPVPDYEGSGEGGGFSPSDLRSAYNLPEEGGEGMTVAITIAYDDPNAEEDLAAYRSHYGLPPCTTVGGCFSKVNQKGEEGNYPEANAHWALETSLDLDMVSATCPECHIVLVEADTSYLDDLGAAVDTAAELGADVISNSWGVEDFPWGSSYNHFFEHPGIPVLAATGDYGYAFYEGGFGRNLSYPAASPDAVAVGGTALRKAENSRGWSESAWSGAGSGCSGYEEKPLWQLDATCPKRSAADVSAVADPNTPVSLYDSFEFPGWLLVGGTSVATPLMAGIEALSSVYARSLPGGDLFYADQSELFDVTSGGNSWAEVCAAPAEDPAGHDYLCNAKPGYDGPTGNGTPDGPFEVTALPPLAISRPATAVSAGTATLHGGLDPQGSATTYRFEYGTTAAYGSSVPVPDASAGSGTAASEVSREISGLSANTTYHYRISATNAAGTSHGEDRTFRTAAPTVTSVSPDSGAASGGTAVTIQGSNFFGVSAVRFGADAAESFKVESANSISAVAPSPTQGLGTVDVTVTTPAGTSATGSADRFTDLLTGPGRVWGVGAEGELGNRHSQTAEVPVEVTGLPKSVAMAPGTYSDAALTSAGTVMTWGENWIGELGNGLGADQVSFVPVEVCAVGVTECPNGPYLEEVAAISTGDNFSLALLRNGTVVGWGQNYEGQLGSGSRSNCHGEWICSRTPVPVCLKSESPCKSANYLRGVTAIAAGGWHSLALLEDGTVMAWGESEYGQLGNGTFTGPEVCGGWYACSIVPEAVPGLSDAVAIAAGANTSYALRRNGTVLSWGENREGEVGDGSLVNRDLPVSVCAEEEVAPCEHVLDGVSEIAAGWLIGYARLDDGTVWDWGSNSQAQLGTGEATEEEVAGCYCKKTPVEVKGLSGVTAISGGGEASSKAMALLTNGHLMSWGTRALGDGRSGWDKGHVPVRVCAAYAPGPCPSGPYLDEEGEITAMGTGSASLTNVSAAPEWKLRDAPDVEGATESELEATSCAASTSCEAVGHDTSTSGVDVTLAEHWNGGGWSIQATPNPGGAASSVLEGVSCASASACVATGHYEDSKGSAVVPLAEHWDGGEWRLEPAPSPEGAEEAKLASVSCVSVSSCIAVGTYKDGSGEYRTLAERWDGTRWSMQSALEPEGAVHAFLLGVSCDSGEACEATGYYVGAGARPLAERWNGATWDVQSTPKPEGASNSYLYGVSCTSAAACTAAGYYYDGSGTIVALAERWDGSGWSIQSTPSPEGAAATHLVGVSCASPSACTASGSYTDGAGAEVPLTESWNGGEWQVHSPPSPEGAEEAQLSGGVSCASASACTAAGYYENGSGRTVTLAERWDGSKWEVRPTPNRDGTGQGQFPGGEPSCASALACEAVGQYTDGTGEHPMAERWNGLRWTLQWTPSPAGAKEAGLISTSCPAVGDCAAVGRYTAASGAVLTLAERLQGGEWSIQPTPNPEGASESWLTSVSCSSASACTATGYYENGSGTWLPLAERWNGTSWSLQTMATPAGAKEARLESVSCPGAGACTATGYYENGSGVRVGLAERWDGTSWEVQSVPTPEGAEGTHLLGVFCVSSEACRASGFYEGAAGKPVALTAAWNASGWSLQSPPAPSGSEESTLVGMSCPTATSCRATGSYRDSSGASVPLAEHWNGTAWAIESVPAPPGSKYALLGGVSCPSADLCIGTGYWQDASAESHTLTEGLGSMPPVAATRSATSVSETEATLNGSFNPNGRGTEYFFEYGPTTSYGDKTASGYASGTSTLLRGKAIGGLTGDQTYHFRMVVSSEAGTVYGGDESFTTPKAPKASTEAATAVRAASATLNGKVNPEGSATNYWFEYGTTTSYGTRAPAGPAPVGSGTSDVAESQAVSGLEAGSTYHYRVVAESEAGTAKGEDEAFTTPKNYFVPTLALSFGSHGTGDGQLQSPSGVAVGPSGDIWVADTENNRIEEFDAEGGYLAKFGAKGVANGQFNRPSAIAVDPSGDVWVADEDNNRIQEFNSKGEFLRKFGTEGSGNGQFRYPAGIAVAPSGDIWVADYGNGRIEEFNSKGEYLAKFGTEGSGNGQFVGPTGIAVAPSGDIWVADTFNNRIQEFDAKGEYLSQFGEEGSGAGQFELPWGIAVDPSGDIWVADYGNGRIQEFDAEGKYLGKFGTEGSGNGQFAGPTGIAVDPSGDIWVADAGNNRVQEWRVPRPTLALSFGSHGSGDGQLQSPSGVAVDPSGDVWVADTENNRIEEFDAEGEYLAKFGTKGVANGQFNRPSAIAIDASGNLWVADEDNNRIQEFNSKGEFLRKFGTEGSGNGQLRYPTGIAVDPSGDIWVSDYGNGRIQEFDAKGEYLAKFGEEGSADGQFVGPTGIAVDRSGDIWVADTFNNRIQEFDAEGEYLAKFGTEGSGDGQLELPFGIAVDPSGDIWVADTFNGRIQEFDAKGEYLGRFGEEGAADGQLESPWGIATDPSGDIWVADTGNDRVQEWR
jgi:sugar lactone lactonase YvrE/alpha-tubulin suppressor-like RCC1 family protein